MLMQSFKHFMKKNLLFRCRHTLSIGLFLALPSISFMVTGCQKKEEEQKVQSIRPVKVLKVQDLGATKVVEFPGEIRSVQRSWLAFEVSGRVIKLFVKEGQYVKKGDVLAKLDSRDYEYAYNAAKAQYETALAVKKRKDQLFENKAASHQAVDLAERDLLQAKAKLNQAKKALEDTKLVADFNGRVAKLLIDDFTNVVAKENVMMIQNNDFLEVAINIPESAVAISIDGKTTEEKVNNTHPVVIFSALPGETYEVKYREAAERPDPATRTYEIKLTFKPRKGSLVRPGMTAKVRAFIPANVANHTKGVPVPVNAILSDGDSASFVWRVDPKKLTISKANVVCGATVGDMNIVQKGLKKGDWIAISGVHQLHEGGKVSIYKSKVAPLK